MSTSDKTHIDEGLYLKVTHRASKSPYDTPSMEIQWFNGSFFMPERLVVDYRLGCFYIIPLSRAALISQRHDFTTMHWSIPILTDETTFNVEKYVTPTTGDIHYKLFFETDQELPDIPKFLTKSKLILSQEALRSLVEFFMVTFEISCNRCKNDFQMLSTYLANRAQNATSSEDLEKQIFDFMHSMNERFNRKEYKLNASTLRLVPTSEKQNIFADVVCPSVEPHKFSAIGMNFPRIEPNEAANSCTPGTLMTLPNEAANTCTPGPLSSLPGPSRGGNNTNDNLRALAAQFLPKKKPASCGYARTLAAARAISVIDHETTAERTVPDCPEEQQPANTANEDQPPSTIENDEQGLSATEKKEQHSSSTEKKEQQASSNEACGSVMQQSIEPCNIATTSSSSLTNNDNIEICVDSCSFSSANAIANEMSAYCPTSVPASLPDQIFDSGFVDFGNYSPCCRPRKKPAGGKQIVPESDSVKDDDAVYKQCYLLDDNEDNVSLSTTDSTPDELSQEDIQKKILALKNVQIYGGETTSEENEEESEANDSRSTILDLDNNSLLNTTPATVHQSDASAQESPNNANVWVNMKGENVRVVDDDSFAENKENVSGNIRNAPPRRRHSRIQKRVNEDNASQVAETEKKSKYDDDTPKGRADAEPPKRHFP